jgi:predicted transcriptional regulator
MAEWTTAADLLDLAQRRHEYLTLLAGGARHKRDVIDGIGDSRSTVDRAVEALHEAGLVVRLDDGAWTVTTKGDVLRQTVERSREAADAIEAAGDLLEHLPCDEPVPPTLFQDAIVERAEAPRPLAISERVRENMAAADSVRGFAVADHGTGVKEAAFDGVFDDDSFEFAYVFDGTLLDRLAADDERFRELCDRPNATAAVYDGLPVGLLIADVGDETRMTVIVYNESGVVCGQITTTDRGAVAWGEALFERYRREGTPLEEWAESTA